MKLYIKQKVFTIGESFTVRNEFNEDVYWVKGSFMRIPKKFTITDQSGKKVATIERQMLKIMAHYKITIEGQPSVVIKRNFTMFKQKFQIEGTNWKLKGDYMSHNYSIVDGKAPVMSLRKHWFTWGDSYELNILDEKHQLLALCVAIVVDNEIEKDRSSSHNSSTSSTSAQ